MPDTLVLRNEAGTLLAELAPLSGGMLTQITFHDREIFSLNRATLQYAPMAAGGMPFLFPFASKTRDDRYTLNGREYRMPMHGLLKNEAFAVKSVHADSAVFWIESNAMWRAQNYPFDFYIELGYRVTGDSVAITAEVTNRSDAPMPHTLGWHPFFRAQNKAGARLTHAMSGHYDYINGVDDALPDTGDLSRRFDDVFFAPKARSFELSCPQEGYSARVCFDDAFQAMVLCTWVEGSICVEPWCGLPDSANSGRFLKWVNAGETRRYKIDIQLSAV